jgi:hypothetical protein
VTPFQEVNLDTQTPPNNQQNTLQIIPPSTLPQPTPSSSVSTPKRFSPKSSLSCHCVMCGKKDVDIPTQNKNICKSCDSSYWLHLSLLFVFKFCKGCKNFFPLNEFKEKPEGTKCFKCRERGRSHYLLKKQQQGKTTERAGTPSSSGSAMLTIGEEPLVIFKKRSRSQDSMDSSSNLSATLALERDYETENGISLQRSTSLPSVSNGPNSYSKPPRKPKTFDNFPSSGRKSLPSDVPVISPILLSTPPYISCAQLNSSTSLPLSEENIQNLLDVSTYNDRLISNNYRSQKKKLSLVTPLSIDTSSDSLKREGDDSEGDSGKEELSQSFDNDLSPPPLYNCTFDPSPIVKTEIDSDYQQLQKKRRKEFDDWQWDPEKNPLMQLASILATASASPSPRNPIPSTRSQKHGEDKSSKDLFQSSPIQI